MYGEARDWLAKFSKTAFWGAKKVIFGNFPTTPHTTLTLWCQSLMLFHNNITSSSMPNGEGKRVSKISVKNRYLKYCRYVEISIFGHLLSLTLSIIGGEPSQLLLSSDTPIKWDIKRPEMPARSKDIIIGISSQRRNFQPFIFNGEVWTKLKWLGRFSHGEMVHVLYLFGISVYRGTIGELPLA